MIKSFGILFFDCLQVEIHQEIKKK